MLKSKLWLGFTKLFIFILCIILMFGTSVNWTRLGSSPNKHFVQFGAEGILAAKTDHNVYFDKGKSGLPILLGLQTQDSKGYVRYLEYSLAGAKWDAVEREDDRVVYKNCFDGVNVEYILEAGKVKENIIVNKPIEEYSFKFIIGKDDKSILRPGTDGTLQVKDKETNEVLWNIESLFAIDSAGEKTEDVVYVLGKECIDGIEYDSIEVILKDTEFIKNAVFPVIIDPTASFAVEEDGQVGVSGDHYPPRGTITCQLDADNFGPNRSIGSRHGEIESDLTVALMKFNTSSIPDGATVYNAYIRVTPGWTVYNENNRSLMVEYFNFSSIGTHCYTTIPVGDANPGIPLSSFTAHVSKNIPLSNLQKINKYGDTGFRFHISNENSNIGRNDLLFRSRDYGTNYPILTVSYGYPPTSPTITSPNGGGTYNNSCNITWNASTDADGDPLTYHLQYSLNNGSTWTDIASGVSGTSYNWNTSAILESTNVLVRVRAYDGNLYGNYDQSDAVFEIKHNQNPTISVTEPSPDGTFSAVTGYNTIPLSGTVTDTDIGDILSVYYRIDGTVGSDGTQIGSNITANGAAQAYSGSVNVGSLSAGDHTLYTWVEDDKGGKSAEVSRIFTIDKTAPTVSFNPAANTKVNSTGTISVTVTATDTAGVNQIKYILKDNNTYVLTEGDLTGVKTGSSYSTTVNTGTNCIYVMAIDNVGNKSAILKSPLYRINKVPSADITNPADETWFKK